MLFEDYHRVSLVACDLGDCMKLALRITSIILLLVVGLGYFVLSGRPIPEQTQFALNLSQLRELAAAPKEQLPVAVEALVVAQGSMPSGLVVAGANMRPLKRVWPSFQLRYEDYSFVIDGAYKEPNQPGQLTVLEAALLRARKVLFTHTHADHVLGVAKAEFYAQIKDKLVLTFEQLNESNHGRRNFPAGGLSGIVALKYDMLKRFAPGVVLIKSPGHSQGSQMIYVQTRDTNEFLLVGDVVWDMGNINSLQTRPKLIGEWLLKGDEALVAQQVRALFEFHQAHPDVHIVISHDANLLQQQFVQGLLVEGFTF